MACSSREAEDVQVNLYPAYINQDNENLWGYINNKGKYIIEPKYSMVNDFIGSVAIVEREGYFGLINYRGEEVLAPQYDNISHINENRYLASKDQKNYLFNQLGEEIPRIQDYSSLGEFHDGRAQVALRNQEGEIKYGYIDQEGRQVIRPSYDLAFDFYQGRSLVKEGDQYLIIDRSGQVLRALDVKEIRPSSNKELYIFSRKGYLYGIMDREGRILIDEKYSLIGQVDQDYIVVGQVDDARELYGVVDHQDQVFLDLEYTDIYLLGQGYLALSKDKKNNIYKRYSIINKNKEALSKERYYNVGGSRKKIVNDLISVASKETSFLLDLKGEKSPLLEELPGYGEIYFDKYVFRTEIDHDLVYYNKDQEIIWEADNRFYIGERQLIDKKYNKDSLNIIYPQFIGYKNRQVQEDLNQVLKEGFLSRKGEPISPQDYSYYRGDYNVSRQGQLLIIEKYSSYLDKVREKSQMDKDIYNINMETGQHYRLEDILRPGVDLVQLEERLGDKHQERTGREDSFSLDWDLAFKYGSGKMYFYINRLQEEDLEGYQELVMDREDLEDLVDFQADFFLNYK